MRFDNAILSVNGIRVFMIKITFSIDQTPIVKFDDWAGVLNLANMWLFQDVRSILLQKISVL